MHSRFWPVVLAVFIVVVVSPVMGADPSYVFVTSTLHNGDLGGLEGADAICNQLAAGNLPGTYKAWLSTASVAAWERVYHNPYGYRLYDGSPVAIELVDVCACSNVDCLINAINQTETGAPAPTNTDIGFACAWTGTWINADACVISPSTCGGWSIGTSGDGRVGDPTDVDLFWTEGSWDTGAYRPCTSSYSLYCFQNDPPLFADDFESGTTDAWDVTTP